MPIARRSILLASGLAAFLLSGHAGHAAERLVITGSSTVAPLVSEIAKRYEQAHSNVRIDVQTGGSHRGMADARRGLADIGMVSRALTDQEQDLVSITIAYDGLTIIVHADNPVRELSASEIVGIYTGKIEKWSALGGVDKDIVVVNKAEGRSTLESFLEYFRLKSNQITADVVAGDNEQAIKAVAGNPYSIGYVSVGNAEYDVGKGVAIRLLPLEGVAASRETVAAQKFPIVRPLTLVLAKEPTPLVQDFIAYATSPEVRDIVESFYYVPPQTGAQQPGS